MARRGVQISQRLLRTSALMSVRSGSAKKAVTVLGLRSHAPGRRNVCAHGFHSCAACANATSTPTDAPTTAAADGAAPAAEAPIDFGSKDAVDVTVASSADASDAPKKPVGLAHVVAKAEAEREAEDALQFGSEPQLPTHLYNHLQSIDLFVKPQELDPAQLAELKAKILAINQKIRSELNMQPAQFYREHYRAREERARPGVLNKAGSHVPNTDFHPLSGGANASDDAPVSDNFLRAQGLNNDPNQEVYDLLSHALPKPLKKKQPCLFCSPPRDHPAEYYRLDYTNVNILHRFLNERGAITAGRFNYNCRKHQRRVAEAIKRARFIGLLSFTNLFHVPREFMNAPDPRPGDNAAEAAATLQSAVWGHRFTAASIPTGNMKMSDVKFWTQEGGDDLSATATTRARRPSRLRGAASGAGADAGAATDATGSPAAAAPKKIRDPNAL